MLYVDTSVWVTSIVEEPRSIDVRSWMEQADPGELAISDWVLAEFSSALSLKVRTKQLDLDQRAAALGAFSAVISASLNILSISGRHFRSAAQFADNHATGIRAGDALHLAVAADHGAAVCTLDFTLAAAGPMLGIETILI
jgi:uncharacterized protein